MPYASDTQNLCAFKGCLTEGGVWAGGFGKALFPFPSCTNPRYEIWLENCGNKSILVRSESKTKKFVLCSDHFTPDSFYDEERTKLRRDAVPEPYSPTFKRLYPLSKSNNRIYDHNYALVPNETEQFLPSYKRNYFPLKTCNVHSNDTSSSEGGKNDNSNKGTEPKINLGSPQLKRNNRIRTYTKKKLNLDKNEDSNVKSLTSIDSATSENLEGLRKCSTRLAGTWTITSNLASSSASNNSTNKRGRVGLRDKEVGILQETNNELRSQNKLLRKLNGQLKQKMKRSEDRNARLKIMLEKVSSIDGFLDLHRCMKLTVRKLIKDEIHKCKISGAK